MRQDGVKVLMAVVKGVCVDSHCGEEKRREEKGAMVSIHQSNNGCSRLTMRETRS